MLPKINRIKKKKDFEIIFKKGASFKNSLLVLKVIKNNFGESRFGFIVSKMVSKKAVARNKIRRRLSEIIRFNMAQMEKGIDAVLIALPGIKDKNFLETKRAVMSLLEKACLPAGRQN